MMARTKRTQRATNVEMNHLEATGRFPPGAGTSRGDVDDTEYTPRLNEEHTPRSSQLRGSETERADPRMPRASGTRSAEDVSHNSVDHIPRQWSPRDAETDSDAECTDADTREDGHDAYIRDSDSSNTPFSVVDTSVPHMAPFRENVRILPPIAPPLSDCKDVLNAFLKTRFSLKTKEDNRLRDPPTIAGESDKWIMTTILGVAIAKGDVLPSKQSF